MQRFYTKRRGLTGKPMPYEFLTWRLMQTYYVQINEGQSNFDPNYSSSAFGPGFLPEHLSPLSSRLKLRPSPEYSLRLQRRVRRELPAAQAHEPARQRQHRPRLAERRLVALRCAPPTIPAERTVGSHTLRGSTAMELLAEAADLEGSADYDLLRDTLLQLRGQLRYSVQCCGFSVEHIRYNWNQVRRLALALQHRAGRHRLDGQLHGRRPARQAGRGSGATVEAARHGRRRLRRRPPGRRTCAPSSPAVEIFGVVLPQGGISWGTGVGMHVLEADLNDPAATRALVEAVAPDRVLHLAGQSSPQHSLLDPGGTLRTNVLGIVHVLDAARCRGLRPDVLVVGSAEEYGPAASEELPLREDGPLRPSSPYAVSKVAQGALAVLYGPAGGMRVVRTRTFHHTGPGRGEAFAESSFARQIAEIEAGLRPPVLKVGNLDAVRDFADVRDVVRAYWLLLEQGEPGAVYNVCTGRGRAIRELLDVLLAASRSKVELRVDPRRLRPSDVPVQVGDPSRFKAATGWEPRIPIERTLVDLLEDWRARVRSTSPAA